MADYPLLPMPAPANRKVNPRGWGGHKPRLPDRQRQVERLGPVFQRLRDALDPDHPLTFGEDPGGIAPERALVFEIAGSVTGFRHAVAKVGGLELLGDEDTESPADGDFAVIDTRKGREGKDRDDKLVGGRLYLAMPDIRALEEILSLWGRYEAGDDAPRGFAPWWHVFKRLRELRAWGPEDRVPEDTVDFIRQRLRDEPDADHRVEIELWSYAARERREKAGRMFLGVLQQAGGKLVHRSSIPEVAYEAALVDLPSEGVEALVGRQDVIALCDDVMLVRPQSSVSFPIAVKETQVDAPPTLPPEDLDVPVAALFDGVPVQRHALLDGRLLVDDPDGLDERSVAARRQHGTAMASLILHGDRNGQEEPLDRLLYVRPVLLPTADGSREEFPPGRLLVDTIYRAVRRMKEGDNDGDATAPSVFLVNLSLGDRRRPFAGPISAWARLLDHLAAKYGILFLVSAGNVGAALSLSTADTVCGFEEAAVPQRRELTLRSLSHESARRTLLSPGEAMNVLTIGAWHEDAHSESPQQTHGPLDPLGDGTGPNITSAVGLGYRKAIKPEILMPGGRELVRVTRFGDALEIQAVQSGRYFGLRAAAPSDDGYLRREALSAGTSAAAALATRAACGLFDALMDEANGGLLADVDSAFYGPVVKALLVHSARWGSEAGVLEGLLASDAGGHVGKKDAIARLIGYGRPSIEAALTCASNRATLIGHGEISVDGDDRAAHEYRVPLPRSLERTTEPRAVTCTLAWFSPSNVRHRMYRRAKLDLASGSMLSHDDGFVDRVKSQPSHDSVRRGSLLHVRFEGDKAVSFLEDGHLCFSVSGSSPAGGLPDSVPYGLAVTVEAGEAVPVYTEIRQRLAVRPRVGGAL